MYDLAIPILCLTLTHTKASWEKHRSWGEYSSKKWKSFLKHHKDKDFVKCNPKGLAVVEPGNPLETFRCKNVGLSVQPIYRDDTDKTRSTTTTSRAMPILDLSLEKAPHPGAGSPLMVVNSSPLVKPMVLPLPRSTKTASLSILVVFPSSLSSPSGGRFARTSITWSLAPKLAVTVFSSLT
jgi:hypothetical protein